MSSQHSPARRDFLKRAACAFAVGGGALTLLPELAHASAIEAIANNPESINLLGPKQGYTPYIGTLVSMLTWMRSAVLESVKNMKVADLDFLLDKKANTIGAMLMHLSATETYYGLNSFDGIDFEKFPQDVKKKWEIPMELGEPARKAIKGHDLDFYLKTLEASRAKTLAELKKRDDKWLLAADHSWGEQPVNNYCKWFHVCEHESNHNGQIKLVRARLPGAPAVKE